METKKEPYEVLIRFGKDGKVSAAHVIWAYVVRDDDKIVSYAPGAAEPAGEGRSDFPLSKAVSAEIAEGLLVNMDLADEVAALKAADVIEHAALAEKDAKIAELQQEIAKLKESPELVVMDKRVVAH